MATSWTLDDLTVIALHDGEGPFFEPRSSAFPDASPEQWAEADRRDPSAVRDGRWWLQFRSFAVRLPSGRVILVDAGIGSAAAPARGWAPVPGRLPAELEAAGVAVDEVDTVVLTHMHTDHIGWSMDDAGEVFFRRARYLLQRAEIEAIDTRAPGIADWLLKPLRASGQLSAVDGDLALDDGVQVVATPGHTPGHQSVLLERGRKTVLVTGDLLVHVLQLIDPTLRYAHEEDPELARASRTELLRRVAGDGSAILATPHLGNPFVAQVRAVVDHQSSASSAPPGWGSTPDLGG